MPTPLSHIFHVYNRLGFGITYPEAKSLSEKSLDQIIQSLIVTSTVATYLTGIKKEEVEGIKEAVYEGASRTELPKLATEKLRELNGDWIKKLLETKNVLLEKQTLFWHNHFACRVGHPYLMQELNNIQRRFAFGSFRDLLVEVCKSPAMLLYLSNQQNRKESPNENFARELLELFTLGRGHYTEQDVQESARAFTGWSFNRDTYAFEFSEKDHDAGEKNIFNRKGNFGGEDVINMIISNKQTAYFISAKMYRYYVNEQVNEAHVKELGEFYYQSQYNTGALLKKIFSSPYFFAAENIGCNIKSPVELLVGLSRKCAVKYDTTRILFKIQELLGQKLFYPPNAGGWPGGKSYIDGSTLLLRMKLPAMLLEKAGPEKTTPPAKAPETENEETDEQLKETNNNNPAGTSVNWDKITADHQHLEPEQLMKAFLAKLPPPAIIAKFKDSALADKKEMILKIVSLPEYSLI